MSVLVCARELKQETELGSARRHRRFMACGVSAPGQVRFRQRAEYNSRGRVRKKHRDALERGHAVAYHDMQPATLATDRLDLRPFAARDLDDLIEAINHREVWATTLMIPHPYTRRDAEEWVKIAAEGWASGRAANWAVVPRTGERAGRVSGGIGLSNINPAHRKAELGFWLTPPLWGCGLMTEAARVVVRFGFERLELNRIYAGHFAGNEASRRVQEKVGLRLEGVLRQDVFKDGQPVDHVMMAVLRG